MLLHLSLARTNYVLISLSAAPIYLKLFYDKFFKFCIMRMSILGSVFLRPHVGVSSNQVPISPDSRNP